MNNDFIVATIRVGVANVVGALLASAATIGLVLPDDAEAGLISAATAATIFAYHLAVRLIAEKVPAFGWLLGVNRAPKYEPPSK